MSGDGRLASGWQHGGRQETQAGDARPEVRPEATRGHESCAIRTEGHRRTLGNRGPREKKPGKRLR